MTVMDTALTFARRYYDKHDVRAVQKMANKANRFIFSDRAARTIGRFCWECPELLLEHRQFAIPPYPYTYFEFDSDSFFSDHPSPKTDDERDRRVGHLITEHGWSITFVQGVTPVDDYLAMSPLATRCKTWMAPDAPTPEKRWDRWDSMRESSDLSDFLRGLPRNTLFDRFPEWDRAKIACLIASAGAAYEGNPRKRLQTWRAILNECSLEWLPTSPSAKRIPMDRTMQSMAGDWRNVTAFLLWLNQRRKVIHTAAPAGHRISRGKRLRYAAHTTVDIDLGRATIVRRAYLAGHRERLSPRRHEVRGHFRHRGGNRACGHVWPDRPDVDGRWLCLRCGMARSWVHAHVRGDAERGWVTKDEYDVSVDHE